LVPQPEQEVEQESLQALNNYFKSEGSEFTKNRDYLFYFALPFIPRPQNNPAVQHLFSKDWLAGLKGRVEGLASQATRHETQLESWYFREAEAHEMKGLEAKNKELSDVLQEVAGKYNVLRQSYLDLI
jgi:hypothetical protein